MWFLPDGSVTYTPAPPAVPSSPVPGAVPPGPVPLGPVRPGFVPPDLVEPDAARPRRGSLALRLSLAVTLVLAVCCGTGLWAGTQIGSAIDRSAHGPRLGSVRGAEPGTARSPQPGDPAHVRTAWMSAQIDATLAAQAQALLRGDERGFVAAAEPGNAAVAGELRRRYSSLRALRIAGWQPVVVNGPSETVGGEARDQWQAMVSLRHCFVVSGCETDGLLVDTRWAEHGGRAVLAKIETSSGSEQGPRPWEVTALRGAAGARTVVATTARYAYRLPTLLREAEKAAVVADRYVVGRVRPDIYRIYLAGSDEWKKWYGGGRPPWAAGYAVGVSGRHIDVVLNAAHTPDGYLDDILRHEMTHAASLIGARHQGDSNWWLIEGLADHAMLHGQPASRHDALASGALHRFIRLGQWDGKATVSAPDEDAAMSDAGARYGVAFLAVRRLSERFGDAKVLTFFEAIVHNGHVVDSASQLAFGMDWAGVHADCVRYIRDRAG